MKELIGLVEPRQVVLVTTGATLEIMGKRQHKDNIITVDWHMPCSFDPFLYAIAIGKGEFSHTMIRQSHVFCVNFMSYEYEQAMIQCGSTTGAAVDKFKHSGLTPVSCTTIDCMRIDEALGYIECEVCAMHDCGDHTVFIGKVVQQQIKGKGKRLFHCDGKRFTTTKI